MTDSQQSADRATHGGLFSSLLGHREREVLSVLRELGSATVQQVAEHLNRGLAYTTVMTTLDRLFRKGLLKRKKENRAFVYTAILSVHDIEGRRATHLVRRFFSETDAGPEILVSCLVNAVHELDSELLDQLEANIRAARTKSVNRAGFSAPPSSTEKEEM